MTLALLSAPVSESLFFFSIKNMQHLLNYYVLLYFSTTIEQPCHQVSVSALLFVLRPSGGAAAEDTHTHTPQKKSRAALCFLLHAADFH